MIQIAYEESLRSVSLQADSSLAVYTGVPLLPGSPDPNYGHQYTFVKVTGVGQVGLVTTKATDRAVGVMQSKPQATGQACTVAIRGFSKVMSGAAVTAGDPITADSTGRAITGTPGTDQIYGTAITTTKNANDLVVVALNVG